MFWNEPRRILVKREVEAGNGKNVFPDFAILWKEMPRRSQDVLA